MRRSSPASAATWPVRRCWRWSRCPPLLVFMPDLVRILFSAKNVGAVDATRIVLIAGALQCRLRLDEVVPRLDRPAEPPDLDARRSRRSCSCRSSAVLGAEWGATGAAAAVLVSSVVFCAYWTFLFLRIRREPRAARAEPAGAAAGSSSRGEDARRMRDLAARRRRAGESRAGGRGVPARPRARRRGGHDRRRAAGSRGRIRCIGSPRSLPRAFVMLARRRLIRSRARRADVVYTTGMFGRSAAGSLAARRPYVVKLTADPAFERARRTGLVGGRRRRSSSRGGGGPAVAALRVARDFELRQAAHVFCPSAYLRELAISWGVPPERSASYRTRRRTCRSCGRGRSCGRASGMNGATLAFAGRLTAQKSLDVALEAVAAADGRLPPPRRRRPRARSRSRPGRASSASTGASASSAPQPRERVRGAVPGRGRHDPVVELGELPAHGGRGARRRDAGARDGGRRRRRGRAATA